MEKLSSTGIVLEDAFIGALEEAINLFAKCGVTGAVRVQRKLGGEKHSESVQICMCWLFLCEEHGVGTCDFGPDTGLLK